MNMDAQCTRACMVAEEPSLLSTHLLRAANISVQAAAAAAAAKKKDELYEE